MPERAIRAQPCPANVCSTSPNPTHLLRSRPSLSALGTMPLSRNPDLHRSPPCVPSRRFTRHLSVASVLATRHLTRSPFLALPYPAFHGLGKSS